MADLNQIMSGMDLDSFDLLKESLVKVVGHYGPHTASLEFKPFECPLAPDFATIGAYPIDYMDEIIAGVTDNINNDLVSDLDLVMLRQFAVSLHKGFAFSDSLINVDNAIDFRIASCRCIDIDSLNSINAKMFSIGVNGVRQDMQDVTVPDLSVYQLLYNSVSFYREYCDGNMQPFADSVLLLQDIAAFYGITRSLKEVTTKEMFLLINRHLAHRVFDIDDGQSVDFARLRRDINLSRLFVKSATVCC